LFNSTQIKYTFNLECYDVLLYIEGLCIVGARSLIPAVLWRDSKHQQGKAVNEPIFELGTSAIGSRSLSHELHGAESFLETATRSATQEFPHILWNPKVHKNPSLVPILSQSNRVHATPFYCCKIHFNIILSRLDLPSGLSPSGFPAKILYAFLFAPVSLANLIRLEFITLIIFGEECHL
jgi:hypothetical protein